MFLPLILLSPSAFPQQRKPLGVQVEQHLDVTAVKVLIENLSRPFGFTVRTGNAEEVLSRASSGKDAVSK